MSLRLNRSNFFIPSLLIYLLIGTSFVVFLSQELVNRTDLYSQIYAVATVIAFLKVFLTAYANISYSLSNKRWFVTGLDILLSVYQIVTVIQGLLWLTGDTYPRNTMWFFLLSTFGYSLHLMLGKLSKLVKWSGLTILIYSLWVFLLHILFFGSDTRFLQWIAISVVIIETIFFFSTLRLIQKSESTS